tara:strand:+ start:650 stop:1183 length:534 start_codon:yes stop_codon:yes gene_type:complete
MIVKPVIQIPIYPAMPKKLIIKKPILKSVSDDFKKNLNDAWIDYWIRIYAVKYSMPLIFHENGLFRLDIQKEDMNNIKIKTNDTNQIILRDRLFKEMKEHELYGMDYVGELDDDEDAPTAEQIIILKEKMLWKIYKPPFTEKLYENKKSLLKLGQENKIKNYYYMSREELIKALLAC